MIIAKPNYFPALSREWSISFSLPGFSSEFELTGALSSARPIIHCRLKCETSTVKALQVPRRCLRKDILSSFGSIGAASVSWFMGLDAPGGRKNFLLLIGRSSLRWFPRRYWDIWSNLQYNYSNLKSFLSAIGKKPHSWHSHRPVPMTLRRCVHVKQPRVTHPWVLREYHRWYCSFDSHFFLKFLHMCTISLPFPYCSLLLLAQFEASLWLRTELTVHRVFCFICRPFFLTTLRQKRSNVKNHVVQHSEGARPPPAALFVILPSRASQSKQIGLDSAEKASEAPVWHEDPCRIAGISRQAGSPLQL